MITHNDNCLPQFGFESLTHQLGRYSSGPLELIDMALLVIGRKYGRLISFMMESLNPTKTV